MMAAISIDRHVVCMEHDFNGATDYHVDFTLLEPLLQEDIIYAITI